MLNKNLGKHTVLDDIIIQLQNYSARQRIYGEFFDPDNPDEVLNIVADAVMLVLQDRGLELQQVFAEPGLTADESIGWHSDPELITQDMIDRGLAAGGHWVQVSNATTLEDLRQLAELEASRHPKETWPDGWDDGGHPLFLVKGQPKKA